MLPLRSLFATLSVLALTAPAQVNAASCTLSPTADQSAAAAVISRARQSAGLSGLRVDPKLSAQAARQACAMAASNRMAHSGGGRGPGPALRRAGYHWSVVSENVAAGPWDLGQVLGAWFGSPSHVSNMMIPQTREMGIGGAIGADGRTQYWSAVFAAPR